MSSKPTSGATAGRLELRHLKTLGPLPVLWDRWRVTGARAPRLQLSDVLRSLRPGTGLMLDLKGIDPRLPASVAAALEREGSERQILVSAQLEPARASGG